VKRSGGAGASPMGPPHDGHGAPARTTAAWVQVAQRAKVRAGTREEWRAQEKNECVSSSGGAAKCGGFGGAAP